MKLKAYKKMLITENRKLLAVKMLHMILVIIKLLKTYLKTFIIEICQ